MVPAPVLLMLSALAFARDESAVVRNGQAGREIFDRHAAISEDERRSYHAAVDGCRMQEDGTASPACDEARDIFIRLDNKVNAFMIRSGELSRFDMVKLMAIQARDCDYSIRQRDRGQRDDHPQACGRFLELSEAAEERDRLAQRADHAELCAQASSARPADCGRTLSIINAALPLTQSACEYRPNWLHQFRNSPHHPMVEVCRRLIFREVELRTDYLARACSTSLTGTRTCRSFSTAKRHLDLLTSSRPTVVSGDGFAGLREPRTW